MDRAKVEFFRHNIGPEEIASCSEVLRGLFHTTGPACARFEEEFARYLGVGHVLTVANCTIGLEIALSVMGVGPGDEVITTPMTFIATANSILRVGARPVFVDVDPATALLHPDMAAKAITPRTKALLPVHLYGQMCDMRGFRKLADRHGLYLIADCAHAVESRRDGLRSADLADAACYSFYTTKNLSCGEGGALATNSEPLAERFRQLRLHGMSKSAADRYSKNYQHWDMVELGYKGNLPDILAALLLPQLPRLDERLARREHLAQRYEHALRGLPGVSLPATVTTDRHARHLFTIWVEQRDLFLGKLQERGIGVAVNYQAIHLLSYYRRQFGYAPGDFPMAERIGGRTISLPLYPLLSDEEADRVIEAVTAVARELFG